MTPTGRCHIIGRLDDNNLEDIVPAIGGYRPEVDLEVLLAALR